MTWIGVGLTETGYVRSSNQDALATLDGLGLWAVADGMGGHRGGDIAAQAAVAAFVARAKEAADQFRRSPSSIAALLPDFFQRAHQAIVEKAQATPELRGMGTTFVAAAIVSDPMPMAWVAHVGDSRAYLFRQGLLTRLTRDHTLMERYLERGLITPELARSHPERHVLTKALGMESAVKPEIASHPMETNDLLVLCTDGLTKMLEDHAIASVLALAERDPARACRMLIDAALDAGGEDNVTVVVCGYRF